LTHISTDKPVYRLGEKVYIRGVVLNAANSKPLAGNSTADAAIRIVGPKGEVVSKGASSTQDSIWAFEWAAPNGSACGEYTVQVKYPDQPWAPAERKFDIRAYRAPRLKTHITFLRDGYGAGEKVTATLEVKRAEGGAPGSAKVTMNARIDGVEINGASANVDENGLCTVNFDLPQKISRGEGTLALIVQDGGVVETASKTIPILLQTVDIQIFPEGGDLVDGYKNRVYIQANQLNGKPADVEGVIESDTNGRQLFGIAKVHTEHEGRGRFEFTPQANEQYFLRVTKPAGITTRYALPPVKLQGAVITTDQEVFKKGRPITLQIGSTLNEVKVSIAKREVELASQVVAMNGSKQSKLKTITMPVPADAEGVLTVTAWDEKGTPLAERLIFREPAKPLNIAITSSKQSYIPGDNAEVKVKTTDADGKPVSAMIGIAVTDDTVLQMVEKREQAPRLPVMVFLEPEVKDLADAHVYLNQSDEKAPLATDLLLGTQGWRRFALVDVDKFILAQGDKAKRALAVDSNSQSASGAFIYKPSRNAGRRIGENDYDTRLGAALKLPENIGRVEGPRDMNLFQIEPTLVDERHYSSGRAERHQKTSPTLPDGSPIPDNDGATASLNSVDRYTFFGSNHGPYFAVVRQFAHRVRNNRNPSDRSDFAETLYWNAAVKTDEKTGEGVVSFGLNDSVTTFQVSADGFSNDGAIGASNLEIKSIQPFYAEAKLPLEVTTGDQILLPISLINATSDLLRNTTIEVALAGPFKLTPILQQMQEVAAGARVRCLQPIQVGFTKGMLPFIVKAKAGSFTDNVTRELTVVLKGFPVEKTFGGLIEAGKMLSTRLLLKAMSFLQVSPQQRRHSRRRWLI